MQQELNFLGKYLIEGIIRLETGLHIGGTQEGIEIGGVDNVVIKDPLTGYPYIPGSSLKGKMRCLLEWRLGKIYSDDKNKFPAHSCENHPEIKQLKVELKKYQQTKNKEKEKEKKQKIEKKLKELINKCEICLIFGTSATASGAQPTRITIRDAFPVDDTINLWKTLLGEAIYTEIKTENTIDRVISQATPRPMERVPAGSEFQLEIIFDIYRNEDKKLLKDVFTAMLLLEDSSLGGSGSRGYGKIKFVFDKNFIKFHSKEYYQTGKTDGKDEIVESLNKIQPIKEKFIHPISGETEIEMITVKQIIESFPNVE